MTIKEMNQKYLNHITLSFTPGTYRYNLSHIKHFEKWCEDNNVFMLEDLTESIIVDYIMHMKKTCENITINKRIGIVKKVLHTAGVDEHFIYTINKYRENRKTFDMIDFDDIKRIKEHSYSLSNKNNDLLSKCLLLILIDTGCRVNELIHIEKKNINFQENKILLTTTKTSRERYVYFYDKTKTEILKMFNLKTSHKYLFHNAEKNRPINYNDITYIMKKYKKKLSLDKLHPHMFRHSLASLMLSNNADIKTVQVVLGHSDLKTTARYLHTNESHVRNTYFSCMPYDV